MKIVETNRFRKSFEKLDQQTRKKAHKQFQLFFRDLFHPSLHTEKLKPKQSNIWSFRVDRNFRVIFTFLNQETILVLDVGPHDIYKKLS